MQQIIQNNRSGQLRIDEVPVPHLQPGGVLVETHYSLVSVGTEGMKVQTARKSLVGKARSRPDLVRQVLTTYKKEGFSSTYRKVMNRLESPAALGYSLTGAVVAVAPDVEDLAVGDLVACAGADYANHAEVVFVPRNLVVKLPPGTPMDLAAFTTLGAIAMQGVRQAEAQVGTTVGVVGLGLLGQITTQLLAVSGCRVFGIDLDPQRVALARELGAEGGCTRRDPALEQAIMSFTGGIGLDVVVITAATRGNDPIELAADIARDRGRLVVVGIIGMEIPHKIFYDKELELRMSRSYGPGRYDPVYEEGGVDYPVEYVRWTEGRNMQSFLHLLAAGKLNLGRLVTHRFPFGDAVQAYDLIAGPEANSVLGVIFQYDQAYKERPGEISFPQAAGEPRAVRLGVIGAGNFARTMLLPHLKANPEVHLEAVATGTPHKTQDAARKFGFAMASCDGMEVIQSQGVNAVVIATRHNLHAPLTTAALRAGKAVFVEKPLALDEAELAEVIQAYREAAHPLLMVGFNRRFAPMVVEARRRMPAIGPYTFHYRVNAGFVPADNWYHDPVLGGGRLIGEGCHFIDLMLYFTGAVPVEVYAASMDDAGVYRHDNLSVTVRFQDGSLGNLLYVACGDTSLPKERLEVFGGGMVAIIDDYRSLIVSHKGKRTQIKSRYAQDKGHKAEMAEFVNR